jgi:hypothetical protein
VNRNIVISVLALVCTCAFAKSTPKETLVVLDKIPTEITYTWQMAGRGSISCSGSTCSSDYMPPSSGTQNIQGAILRLRRADSSIVIAQCDSKINVKSSVLLAMATQDGTSPTVYRDCRMPEPGSIVDAEFGIASVKLSFVTPSTDLSGRIFSETYLVKRILHPAPSLEIANTSDFESETGTGAIACGPEKTLLKIGTEKNQHPLSEPDAGQALIYVIQQDEFRVIMMGKFPTRFGLDGEWIGGNESESYFSSSVAPGLHHLCADWEIAFAHHVRPVSLAKFQAKAGETYYFRSRVVFASMNGEGERSITLEPITESQGKELIAKTALSITKSR